MTGRCSAATKPPFTVLAFTIGFTHPIDTYGDDLLILWNAWYNIMCIYDNKISWRNQCPYTRVSANDREIKQRRDIFPILYSGTRFNDSNPHGWIYGQLGKDGKGFVDVDYSKNLAELCFESPRSCCMKNRVFYSCRL